MKLSVLGLSGSLRRPSLTTTLVDAVLASVDRRLDAEPPRRISTAMRSSARRVGPDRARRRGSLPAGRRNVRIIQLAVDTGIAGAAIDETIRFVRTNSRPWIDSGLDHAWQDLYTIQAVGDLTIRLHAAQALQDRAGHAIDAAVADPTADTVTQAQIATPEAKVLSTEIALAATNKLFELAGTRSTLAEHNLDRHWRNARTHTLHDPVRWRYAIVGNHALNGVNPPLHAWS